MEKLLASTHETIVTEIISKGLITCKLPYVEKPVTMYVVAIDLPKVLTDLLASDQVVVHSDITIPTYKDGAIQMLNYTHQEVLDGNFTVQG